jgi:alginate O-acetyltransferase complex protein AlgI
MLFNSYEFICLYLPITLIIYFFLNKKRLIIPARLWLVISSLFFYSYWNPKYLPLLLGTILFNFYVGKILSTCSYRLFFKKSIFIFGICANVALLGYFKYTDFLLENFNFVFSYDVPPQNIILPLAISYFTFQQIAYLVDSYQGRTSEHNLLNYSLFVSFFPQLIMGPITHHKEIISQFGKPFKTRFNYNHIALGLFIFSIGFAKKILLADSLIGYGHAAFNEAQQLTMIEAWYAALSYTLAYYFDLSGYADMAIGLGKMFNINIPINFNSPYKARNFSDYWSRWHITLSRFLTWYVYVPLGGNKKGRYRSYINIMLTFLVSGIWHGAGWTFIVWGIMNGIFVVIAQVMKNMNLQLNYYLAWFLTFIGVIIARVLFVSNNISDAFYVTYTMFDLNALVVDNLPHANLYYQTPYLVVGLFIALFLKNSHDMAQNFKPNLKYAMYTSLLLIASLITLSENVEFLYFQF